MTLEIKVCNLDALEDMFDLQTEILSKYVPDEIEKDTYKKRLLKVVGRLLMEEEKLYAP